MLPLLDKYTVWQVIKALEQQDLTHLRDFNPSSLVTVALRNAEKKKKTRRNYFKFYVITIMQKRQPKLKVQARETLPLFYICF